MIEFVVVVVVVHAYYLFEINLDMYIRDSLWQGKRKGDGELPGFSLSRVEG